MCIGFHTGLDSMFSFSNASIMSSGFTFEFAFNVITDNQWFGTASTGTGCISISGICLNASLYLLYMSVFCFILKSITFNCPLPIPATILLIL